MLAADVLRSRLKIFIYRSNLKRLHKRDKMASSSMIESIQDDDVHTEFSDYEKVGNLARSDSGTGEGAF